MKYLAMLLLAFPLIAHAGTIGEGFSDRNRVTIGYDYTFMSTTAWHLQANVGTLIGLSTSPAQKQQGLIQDALVRTHYNYTLYWGESLLYQDSHAFISIGVIELNTPTPYLTSKYQFLDDLGLRFGAYRIMFRHISNGNTGGRNGGESMLYISADY